MTWFCGTRVLVLATFLSLGSWPATGAAGARPESPPPPVILTEAVKGQVVRIEGESYVIKGAKEEEIRIEAGKDTLLDSSIRIGDVVEAEVSGDGHAKSIRKVSR